MLLNKVVWGGFSQLLLLETAFSQNSKSLFFFTWIVLNKALFVLLAAIIFRS